MTILVTVGLLGIAAGTIGAIAYVSAGCYLAFGDTLFSLVGVSCPILW
jgi:hypothetical protein